MPDWTIIHRLRSGNYYTYAGDDVISRDRPGSYQAAPGHADTDSGEGSGMISYARSAGGVSVDLSMASAPMARPTPLRPSLACTE